MFAPRKTLHSTPDFVVDKISDVFNGQEQYFFDIGCGDGRVLFNIANKFPACKCIGWEINSQRAVETQERVRQAGMKDRIQVRGRNFLDDLESVYMNESTEDAIDFSKVVVFCYLTKRGLVRLLPHFQNLQVRVVTFLYNFPATKPTNKVVATDPTDANRMFLLYEYDFRRVIDYDVTLRLRERTRLVSMIVGFAAIASWLAK